MQIIDFAIGHVVKHFTGRHFTRCRMTIKCKQMAYLNISSNDVESHTLQDTDY